MGGPLWFLRINPLRRARLADARLRALLADLAAAETAVRTAAQAASADLHDRVGAAGDDGERRALVALRRAVHRDRDPRPADGPPPAGPTAQWVAARERRAGLRAAVAAEHGTAAERERAGLAALLADDDLRRALALVAPEVAQEAQRYRAAVAAGPVPARTRKSERGLLQYVTRAMVRTSPLSRFTAVGLAVPEPGAPGPDAADPAGAVAFGDLDRVMLDHVLGGLALPADPADAHVGVPPTSHLDPVAGRLYLLRVAGGELRRHAVPLTPPVQRLLDAVAMGPRRVRAVAAELAGAAGGAHDGPAHDGPAHDAAVASVLGAVRAGVLSPSGAPEDATRPVPELLAHPAAPEPLRRVRDRLPELSTGAVADRPALLDALAADLGDASRAAGRPARIVVEEDYVLPPAAVDPGAWARPLADLGPAVELLSVFDWLHDVRLMLSAAFVERFGAGADVRLTEHARDLVGEVARRAAVMDAAFRAGGDPPPGTGPADGSLDRLQAARRRVTHDVHALLGKADAAGAADVALTAADALELVAGVPDRVRAVPLLYGVLVQSAGGRLVVNDGLPGHGMLYGRFLHADAALGGDARARLGGRLTALLGGDGVRVVEDLGLHGLSVNAHARVLPDALGAEDWSALRLVHDPATDALHVEDADGARLRVLPMGTGHPGLFPPPLSVASGLTISGRLYSGLVGGWHAASGRDATATRACPLLRVGEVVLERRRWYGGDEFATAVAAGPDEADRLLALAAWRARHGVPEEVVLKTTPEDEGPLAAGAPDVTANRLAQKPQYVDLSSALAARVLPRMLERRTGAGFVEEALPAVGDSAHATEWVVEVGRRGGGRFGYGGELL